MAIGSHMPIITLNVNELNAPTKRHDWLNGLKTTTTTHTQTNIYILQ